MARKSAQNEKAPGSLKRRLLIGVSFVAVVTLAFVGMYVFSRVEDFLIRDPRFAIPAAADYGEGSPNIRITGLKYSARDRVRQIFARDIGRSLYLFPTAERRRNLLAVNWVKDATVERVWPNQVRVRVVERRPVAFVPAGHVAGGGQRFALIDQEGEILNLPDKAAFRLPVLLGVGEELNVTTRRERLGRALRVLKEIGPLAEQISEIDVTRPASARVTMEAGGRAVTLNLGNERFAVRMKNFLNHQEEIRLRLPDATVLDMRLEDRITATE